MTLAKQKKYDCNLTDLREMNNVFIRFAPIRQTGLKKQENLS